MSGLERVIENKIRQAMEEGAFDNLPGKGKPLKLDENPFVDKDWQMAFRLLEKEGFALPWMEKRNQIEGEYARAREALARSWAWRAEQGAGGEVEFWVEQEWKTALRRFEDKAAELNKRIDDYNLEIPVDIFYRKRIRVEAVLAELGVGGEGA